MSNVELEEMFKNAVHIGHRTHKWNPRMKKFIHGEVNGIHIINLEQTVTLLEKALTFLSKSAAEGKTILFVSTKPQSVKVLEAAAKECNMPYVVTSWIPGLLTNFDTVKTRIRYLSTLKEEESTGEFSKYTKKEAVKLHKVIEKLELALGGVQNMKTLPDVLVVVDVVRDRIVVTEARKLGIPVVGLVDTNADPTIVDYPVPGNDDALKSLVYFIDRIKDAVKKPAKA